MKKITVLCLFCLISLSSFAQESSLNEDFNSSCASATGFPYGWSVYSPVAGLSDSGYWHCAPAGGRYNTPGMECTGDFSGAYHTDTCLLLTPELDISDYTGSVFLQFDTKTTFVSGERLTVLLTTDSLAPLSADSVFGINPVIGPGDSAGWVTHQIDLSAHRFYLFYAAFMYTSVNTFGTDWYIDNVLLTTWPLAVGDVASHKIPLTVIGTATAQEIKLSYNVSPGQYDIVVYDMMGSAAYKETFIAGQGQQRHIIADANLAPGMYCIKMSNASGYGVVKAMVQ